MDVPLLDHQVPTYYILATAEASSNLARFDGIHYGHRSKAAKGVDETYRLSRTEGFGPEVKRRILLGTFVLSAGYYDAYYAQAQRVRRILRDNTLEA
jgi:aspartyl-tRNA(Asn)/glutamyl-tRNA(Gln) amidotransferase subunit A